MQKNAFALVLLLTAASFTGCNHPYARMATQQDPKYPVGRDSKIAMSESFNPTTVNIATRLAGETIEAQMRALGFPHYPENEADYVLSFSIANQDVSQSYTVNVPTISNMVGTAGDHPVSGTVFGNEVVPQTRMVNMTLLKLWLTRTHEPKVEIWSGSISAEADEVQKYSGPFYRALLEHVGETTSGTVQLDAEKLPAK